VGRADAFGGAGEACTPMCPAAGWRFDPATGLEASGLAAVPCRPRLDPVLRARRLGCQADGSAGGWSLVVAVAVGSVPRWFTSAGRGRSEEGRWSGCRNRCSIGVVAMAATLPYQDAVNLRANRSVQVDDRASVHANDRQVGLFSL
jgi:hypothetical protein